MGVNLGPHPTLPGLSGASRTSAGRVLDRPVFMVGAERSGSTLLRLMLDHHPEIAFFFEFEYSVSRMPEASGWPDLAEYYEFLEGDRIFRAARLAVDRSLDYPHLIDSFLRQKRDRDGKPLVGAVVHYEYDRLLRIWPDARFIHILRDGRDVARSVIANGLAGNMYTAARTWDRAERLWSAFSRELPAGRWIEVRYEDLATKTEATLGRVCEFMGVSYDPAMLSYSEHSTYQAPSSTKVSQWKAKATPDEVRLAEVLIGDLLAERGYESSGYPPLKITGAMAARLKLQDRLYRLQHRRRIYGIRTWLAELIARRMKIRPWHKALQQKINDIEDSLCK